MSIKEMKQAFSVVVLSETLLGCVGNGVSDYFFDSSKAEDVSINAVTNEDYTTPTPSPSGTPDPSATPDPSVTPTPSPSATPDPSSTPVGGTPTPTPTATPAVSPTPSVSPTPICTVDTTTKDLRIMFMIDNSGSTNTTDPNHYYRVKTIQDFVTNYGSHTNLTYDFGYFSGTTARVYDSVQAQFVANPAHPFGAAADLSSALSIYSNLASSGNTPYAAAFSALQRDVHNDEASGIKEDYVVVFMSDGQPTDISGNVATGITTMVQNLRMEAESNGTSHLTVSTVYFGPASDHVSVGNLQTMASEGQGQFVDTNQNAQLQINDIISVPNCH